MVENTKYKAVRAGRMTIHRTDKKRRFFRLQALRDIPLHGVKAGDWGGYVTRKDALSQDGSCWIGGTAQVIGGIHVEDSAYITDEAVVINPKKSSYRFTINKTAKVSGRATITSVVTTSKVSSSLTDTAHIYDDAVVDNLVLVSGTTQIYDNAYMANPTSVSDSKIFGNSRTGIKANFSQVNLSGNSTVGDDVNGWYCVISGDSVVGDNNKIHKMVVHDENIPPGTHGGSKEIQYSAPDAESVLKEAAKEAAEKAAKEQADVAEAEVAAIVSAKNVSNALLTAYEQVCEKIASYERDIVKIIKYPVMADKTDPLTLDMVMAFNNAQLLSAEPESSEFKDAVTHLQKAFIVAESNARKIASSLLSETEKKKTAKATDLFRVASNEASSEQEKKVAFVQGFKQLEGIVDVPDAAIDTFRIKIGLPELEM